MDRRRRRILRAAGLSLLGGVAGCLGDDGSPDAGEEPPDGTTASDPGGTTTARPASLGTTRTVSGNPVTVAEIELRDSVVYAPYPDELGVHDADGGRFVFVRIEAPEGGPDRDAIALVIGDRRLSPGLPFAHLGIHGLDSVYRPDDPDRQWLGFRVPAPLEGGPVRVEAGEAAWRLPGEAVERLRRPKPSFELVGVSVPDSVDAGGTLELGLTVRNDGDRTGTFRAVFVATGAGFPCCVSRPVVAEVGAGASDRVGATFGEDRSNVPREGDVDVRIKSPAGGRESTVPVRDPTSSGNG